MLSAISLVEIQRRGAVLARNAFDLVARRVGVHQVDENQQTHAVRIVDEGLQLFGRPEARGAREVARDLVAERGVIRMLRKRHDLNGVVARVPDSREHVGSKLVVRSYLRLFLCDANVGLVHEQGDVVSRGRGMAPGIGLARLPDLRVEAASARVLHDATDPSWHPVATSSVPVDLEPVGITVGQGVARQSKLPHAVIATNERVLWSCLPVREGSLEMDRSRVGRPLPEHPAAISEV